MNSDLSPFLEHSFPDDPNLLVIPIQITGKCQPDIKFTEITYKLWRHCVYISASQEGKGMHVRFESFELWCSGDWDVGHRYTGQGLRATSPFLFPRPRGGQALSRARESSLANSFSGRVLSATGLG